MNSQLNEIESDENNQFNSDENKENKNLELLRLSTNKNLIKKISQIGFILDEIKSLLQNENEEIELENQCYSQEKLEKPREEVKRKIEFLISDNFVKTEANDVKRIKLEVNDDVELSTSKSLSLIELKPNTLNSAMNFHDESKDESEGESEDELIEYKAVDKSQSKTFTERRRQKWNPIVKKFTENYKLINNVKNFSSTEELYQHFLEYLKIENIPKVNKSTFSDSLNNLSLFRKSQKKIKIIKNGNETIKYIRGYYCQIIVQSKYLK